MRLIAEFRKENLTIWLMPVLMWWLFSVVALFLLIQLPRLMGHPDPTGTFKESLAVCLACGASVVMCWVVLFRYKRIKGIQPTHRIRILIWVWSAAYSIGLIGWFLFQLMRR
jgi:hypothetical protein